MILQISNRMKLIFAILFTLPFLHSCLKTAAEIQKEQEMEQILISARESHATVADLTAKNKELQDQISQLQGKVDELQLSIGKKESSPQTVEQQLKLTAEVEELKTGNQKLILQLGEHETKIQKLEEQFKGMTAQTVKAEKFESKGVQNKELTIDDVEKLFEDKKYDDVVSACNNLLKSKISDGKKNRCRFAQGVSYKELKQYDEGLLVLSQIYTDWPKSSLAPESLLEIGKILLEKKQEKEAHLMFKKLANEYPKTLASKEAKKLIKN